MGERDSSRAAGNVLPKKDIRFSRASDRLTKEERDTFGTWLEIVKDRFQTAAHERREQYGSDTDRIRITDHVAAARSVGTDGRGIVELNGIPAIVGYESRRTEFHYAGQPDFPRTAFDLVENRGSVVTLTLNPEADDPEVLKFDFDWDDPVEEIARLGEEMSVNGQEMEPHHARYYVMTLIDQAGQALLDRR